MSRALRITLWSVGLVAVAVGATLFWIESQLRPEPLGIRVKGLLADAGIKGGITRVEASLDGKFSADGVDLVLADGTKIAAASLKGEADLFAASSSRRSRWTSARAEPSLLRPRHPPRRRRPRCRLSSSGLTP
jgi:hypothetical protein